MLTGWVAATGSNYDEYYELYVEDEREESISSYFEANDNDDAAVYYCGYSEDGEEGDGHAKKNTWRKLWKPEDVAEEESDDLEWFWFNRDGKLYVTDTASSADAIKYKFTDGVLVVDGSQIAVSKRKVNSRDYWFDGDGVMLSGFYLINEEEETPNFQMYYFGGSDDGSMKTGSQSIRDDAGDTYRFYFSTDTSDRGAGITGNKSNKLYYYGYLIEADEYRYQIAQINVDGEDHYFIVNANGSIQHSKSEYREDGDTLIDAREYADEFDYAPASPAEFRYSIVLSDESTFTDVADLIDAMTASGLPYIQAGEFVEIQ